MQTYYLHPQPELIGNLIDALYPSGFLQKRANINPVVGFFSEIFAANPNRLPEWQLLTAKQEEHLPFARAAAQPDLTRDLIIFRGSPVPTKPQ